MSGKGGAGAPEPVASPRFPEPGPGLCPVMSRVSGCWRPPGRRRPPASCQPCARPAARACLLLCSQSWVTEEELPSEPLKRPACPACCADLPDGPACSVLGPRGEGWGCSVRDERALRAAHPPAGWECKPGGSRDGRKNRCVSPATCREPCRLRAGTPFSCSSCGTRQAGPCSPEARGPGSRPVLCKELDVFKLRDVRVGP